MYPRIARAAPYGQGVQGKAPCVKPQLVRSMCSEWWRLLMCTAEGVGVRCDLHSLSLVAETGGSQVQRCPSTHGAEVFKAAYAKQGTEWLVGKPACLNWPWWLRAVASASRKCYERLIHRWDAS